MNQPFYIKGGLVLILVVLFILIISISGNIGFWLAVAFFSIIGLFLLFSIGRQIRDVYIKRLQDLNTKYFSLKLIATIMGFFFVSGTLLYMGVFYTMTHDEELYKFLGHDIKFTTPEYLLRSMVDSLGLFMLDVDTNTLDRLDEHEFLKLWLFILAALSFLSTVIFLLGLIYSRMRAYYKFNYLTNLSNKRNHLYLFFGNNEPSELLIKDIIKNDSEAVPIIIDYAKEEDNENDGWTQIVNFITQNPKTLKKAESIGAYVTMASQKLYELDPKVTSNKNFDAFSQLGLKRIKKLLNQLSKIDFPELHIFFMDEAEDLNIRNIITLAKDKNFLSLMQSVPHCIYCHARVNGPNKVIEDLALNKSLKLKLIDSSHIAIELLKTKPEFHPVNVVDFSKENPGTVTTTLNTLIVGFGEVGRDAFRFLYEFGAFPDSENINRRNGFKCKIVDKNLNNIEGTFKSTMPGIFNQDPEQNGDPNKNVSVDFYQTDYNSDTFYSDVLNDQFAKEVNYIIISIGNNDEAISLATRIFNKVRSCREDISNLRIFVRCTDDNKVESIEKIADHYNYGYGNGRDNTPVIYIFGQPERTYTYDMVVSDRLEENGKLFFKKYNEVNHENKTWEQRYEELTDREVPNIENLRQLRRKVSQDKANALHASTKIKILRNYLPDINKDESANDLTSFYRRYFNPDGSANVVGSGPDIHYPGLSEYENKIILNLAILEHIRWSAAHELMGYVFNDETSECDERRMRHNCLCEWDKLDSQSKLVTSWNCDYKKYDFCVIDTTLALYKDRLVDN